MNPAQEVTHDVSGKVCIVTGANTGIGEVTARELARAGGHVFLACRSRDKTMPVIEAIKSETDNEKVEFLSLDLASLASVRTCAEEFLARDLPLHLLINNAGLAGQRGLTKDGFELTFGVNHLGHFLFTTLLMSRIVESAPARIVNVSSKSHYQAKGIDWDALREPTRSVSGLNEYSVSKLCNVLFTKELARRLPEGVTTHALHPGVVASDVWRKVPWPIRPIIKKFMITNEEGARTTLHCATSPELSHETGLYWDAMKPRRESRLAQDEELAKELWRRSEEWVS